MLKSYLMYLYKAFLRNFKNAEMFWYPESRQVLLNLVKGFSALGITEGLDYNNNVF